jgi:hypothetical protein
MGQALSVDGLVDTARELTAPTETSVDDEPVIFELSPASAEQVTQQIRAMVERTWEYIAIAYQGRAYTALGYGSWDEYVDDRLGDLRLTVPRAERPHAVAALTNARMSLRAIAKVLGVGLGTIHRDLVARPTEKGSVADDVVPSEVEGRDGKQYRRRKPAVAACSICGESHPVGSDECPWDLFAQGLGPRPDRKERQQAEGIPSASDVPSDEVPGEGSIESSVVGTVAEAVTRAVCMVDELDGLPQLIEEIELAGRPRGTIGFESELAARVRELIELLRVQAGAIAELADRLERCGEAEAKVSRS